MRPYIFLFVFVLFIILSPASIYSQNRRIVSEHETGIKLGYPFTAGGFSGYLRGTGSGSLYYVPIVMGDLFLSAGLDFTGYSLTESSYSYMYAVSVSAAPSYMVYTYQNAGIYTGISLSGNYFYLNADKTGKTLYTFKAGAGAEAGIIYRFSSLFSGKIGCGYGYIPFADRSLHSLTLFGGFSFNFNSVSETAVIAAESEELRQMRKADQLYSEGVRKMEARDVYGARVLFLKAVKAYKKHSDSENMLEKINTYEKEFKVAADLSSKGRSYEAIPILEKLKPVMAEAEAELIRIRAILLSGVADLEREGVAAYENRDYENCIAIMKRIALIDPANSTASIYLPRARKRLEAVKKFR